MNFIKTGYYTYPNDEYEIMFADSYLNSTNIGLDYSDKINFFNEMLSKISLDNSVDKQKSSKLLNSSSSSNVNVCDDTKDKWITCNDLFSDDKYGNTCNSVIPEYFSLETSSTYYFLKILAKSLLYDSTSEHVKLKIEFNGNLSEFTGLVKDDIEKISIKKIFRRDKKTNMPSYEELSDGGHLIMLIGPSASGKTYHAKNAIKIISSSLSDRGYPKYFFCLDGGIYREQSFVYQKILEQIHSKCVSGLSDYEGLFKKHNPIGWMTTFYAKNNFNLCVASTLVSELSKEKFSLSPFEKIVEKYKNMAGIPVNEPNLYYKLVFIMIYQHKTGGVNCDYSLIDEKYKCNGCLAEGLKRQQKEGKKYSSSSYDFSKMICDKIINKYSSTNLCLTIHNATGGSGNIHLYTLKRPEKNSENKIIANKIITNLSNYKQYERINEDIVDAYRSSKKMLGIFGGNNQRSCRGHNRRFNHTKTKKNRTLY